jgi:hypothetical protein
MSSLELFTLTQKAIMANAEIIAKSKIVEPTIVLGCFDESGKWVDSAGVFVFAGIVIFQNSLHELTDKWAKRLKDDGLSHTSMKEAMHFDGPYAALKNHPEKRDAVLRDLANFIASAPSFRVATPMERATLDAFKALPCSDQKKLGDDPYYAGFESCIIGALQSRTDILIHIVCDLAEQYSEKCVAVFHKMRRMQPIIKARCLGIAFADDEAHAGLQAADMIAYCARAEVLAKTGQKELAPIVREIIQLFNSQDQSVHAVSYRLEGKGLGDGEFEINP